MNIIEFFLDTSLKSTGKRKLVVSALTSKELTISTFLQLKNQQTEIALKAMEEISQKEATVIDENWLKFTMVKEIVENEI